MKKRLDLIDRGALGIGKANPLVFEKAEYAHGWNSAIAIIENAPTVDAVPVDDIKMHYLMIDENGVPEVKLQFGERILILHTDPVKLKAFVHGEWVDIAFGDISKWRK